MRLTGFSRQMAISVWTASMLAVLLATGVSALADDPADEAREIAAVANFHGGLVVHIGCGAGELTAALRLADNCVVQGLEADAKRVTAARNSIDAKGMYGAVSVVPWSGERLPYVDNLVTLVVCEDPKALPRKEIMRVLRPHGAVVVKRNGEWTAKFKPAQPGTDEWEQHFHGADNNAVADDTVVGPPRHYQWIGDPEWQRSHLAMPSINSMVSTRGRLFTVEDLASAEHPALPGKQALVARDAFNGIILWQVKFKDWHPTYIRNKEMPVQIQRRVAAIGDVVYCTPGYTAPITAFDAATGQVIKTFAETEKTMEFVYAAGVLFAVTGDQSDISPALAEDGTSALRDSRFRREAYGPLISKPEVPQNEILAVDAESGKVLWQISAEDMQGYEGGTLGVIGDRVVFSTAKELVCLDRTTGKPAWRVPAPIVLKGPPGIAVSLVLAEQGAYLADSKELRAFRLTDGEQLWSTPATINHHKPPDVFVTNGLVWAAGYDASTGRPAPQLGLPRMGVNGFDALTGKVVKEVDQAMLGPMGHDRCYRNRITSQYYINTVSGGSDFLDMSAATEFPNPWIRSTCGIGPLPCNGLFYAGPPSCSCANSVMLNGLNAMAPEPGLSQSNEEIEVDGETILEKGPAFAEMAQAAQGNSAGKNDWPTYRCNNARTGSTANQVPALVGKRWETKIGTRASAPVIVGGIVFISNIDGHTVYAISAADGKVVWKFFADGRVDSPPTYHQGLLLFGCRDGSLYCVRAADGELAWRLRPRSPRLICAYGQTESAWPICGNVLVRDGVAYFAAGRNTFTDGGIFVYAVEPRTGKVIHQKRMYGPYGDNGFPIENREVVKGMSIEGFKGDIFLADDELVYLRHQAFQPNLMPVKLQDVTRPHLIPSHGFLETIPQHRSFWTIDTMLHYDIPTGLGGIHGDILAIDGSRFYEVRGYAPGRTFAFDPREKGYTLFAGIYGAEAESAKDKADADEPAVDRKALNRGKKATAGKRKKKAQPKVAPSKELWSSNIPLTGKAIALAGDVLFVAGTPVVFPEDDLAKAYEGRMGGVLWAASAADGKKLAEYKLEAPPRWDGLAAADGLLFVSLADGRILCMGPQLNSH